MGLGEGQGKASLGECWSTDPDLANRDPNNINDHLAVSERIINCLILNYCLKFSSDAKIRKGKCQRKNLCWYFKQIYISLYMYVKSNCQQKNVLIDA